MKNIYTSFLLLSILFFSCGGGDSQIIEIEPKPDVEVTWTINSNATHFSSKGESESIIVESNSDWVVATDQGWCSVSPSKGYIGQTSIKITATSNHLDTERSATLKFTSGIYSYQYKVTQDAGKEEDYVPEGYQLVWQEEFDDADSKAGKPILPNTDKWWYENFAKGTVNNELQRYVGGFLDQDTVAFISDGTLKIVAKEHKSEVISARINTNESWTYGYFEARLKLPSGKGTWPAFWMMPQDFKQWPLDGEIDIMEYVGYQPNVVHATVHTEAYNHMIGTQKGASTTIQNAETDFHVYAVEWTADKIVGYVDGEAYFTFKNDGKGDINTWPFNKAFYLKLNLAWGGDWGGAQGIDPSALPATYEIDYVRVYQK